MSDQPQAYLVQGFFFQERKRLSIGYVPIEGAVAMITPAVMMCDMFAGILHRDELGGWVGSLTDRFGDSTLSYGSVSSNILQFEKCYDHRGDPIRYRFTWNGDHWSGEYEGDHVGRGIANCILTPLPEAMLEPPGN